MLFSFDERMDEWTEIYTCDELTFSIDVDVNVDATKNEIGMKRRRKEKKCWKSWIVVGGRWLFCSFVRSHFESFRAQFREWIAADQQRKEERERKKRERDNGFGGKDEHEDVKRAKIKTAINKSWKCSDTKIEDNQHVNTNSRETTLYLTWHRKKKMETDT